MDIGINNPLGVEGNELTNSYLSKMPALRPLVLLTKGFLLQRGLNDASKGGLGSFAITCLCISFLQVRSVPYIHSFNAPFLFLAN